ncbi:MAG: hypothetical protein GX801_11485 [Fibrobacter sp.]|nr:hypothetical protein [Fibrobacter sp.]
MTFANLRKLIILSLLTLSMAFFGCAGSGGGGGGSDYYDDGGAEAAASRPVKKDELKQAEKEANDLETENHELRRQIFEAKNKLGIPVDQDEE